MNRTFSPTVMLVDDDPAILDVLSRRFYEHTSLGVLAVNNLQDALSIICSEETSVDAIVCDLSFTETTQDESNALYDGLDFLHKAAKERPDLPLYICSAYSDHDAFRAKGREIGVGAKNWFQKLEMDAKKPWEQIERNLYRSVLRSDKKLYQKAKDNGFTDDTDDRELIDLIRNRIKPIRETFLPTLSPLYKTLKPIRVVCEEHEEEGQEKRVVAEAPSLGLIVPGEGATVENALEDLSDIIVEQYKEFVEMNPCLIVGYAEKVFERLRVHIIEKQNSPLISQ